MALKDDEYQKALAESYPTQVKDYYGTNTPYQVGADTRQMAGAVARGVGRAASIGTPLDMASRAAAENIGQRVGTFAGGVADFARGLTGQPRFAATTANREQTAGAPTAQRTQAAPNRVPVVTPQEMDRMRNNAPEPAAAPATRPATRAVSAPERTAQQTVATRAAPAIAPDMRTQELVGNYRRDKDRQQRETERDQYYRALDQFTPTSGDTWFNFMQKGLQRRALTQAYNDERQRRQMDDQFALQENRQGFEATQADRRYGQETALQERRLQATSDEAQREFERNKPYKESDMNYRSALAEGARAQSGLVGENLKSVQQRNAMIEEYNNPNTTAPRRNQIRAILGKGKEGESPFDKAVATNLGMNLGTDTGSQVLALYGQAEAEASDPNSPYYGQPAAAYAALEAALGVEKKAEGGVIGGQGAQFGGLPQDEDLAMSADLYRKYAVNTQAMGGTPVPPERFINLLNGVRDQMAVQPNQDPSAMGMGYAVGGAVSVAGHEVSGPGTGTSDSIPAVVDGQRPAALSDGEFVFTNSATENVGSVNLKHIMDGLDRGDPAIVAGAIALAAKAAGSKNRQAPGGN